MLRRTSPPLDVSVLPDGRRRLNRPLSYLIDGVNITVPAGFVTDYSSHPALSRFIVRFDKVDYAGVVHDWLYQTGEMSRSKADKIWRRVAQYGTHSANWAQAWSSWLGIRLGGWRTWRKYRKADK